MKKHTTQTFLGLGVIVAATAFTFFASYLYATGWAKSKSQLGITPSVKLVQ